MIEALARVPVEVELASEFRNRDPLVSERVMCLAISQSGETADTLAAVQVAKARGAKAYAICNVVGSAISRECDGGTLFTRAGPEIGVASTKAFTTQLAGALPRSRSSSAGCAARSPPSRRASCSRSCAASPPGWSR